MLLDEQIDKVMGMIGPLTQTVSTVLLIFKDERMVDLTNVALSSHPLAPTVVKEYDDTGALLHNGSRMKYLVIPDNEMGAKVILQQQCDFVSPVNTFVNPDVNKSIIDLREFIGLNKMNTIKVH